MKMKRVFVWMMLGVAAFAFTTKAGAEEKNEAYRNRRLLEEEYALAKTPQFYFMFNLGQKTIELKTRGIVLRKWTAKEIRLSGAPASFKIISLKMKSTMTPPKRRVIKPGESEEPTVITKKSGEIELETYEVFDMPKTFDFVMDEGICISVELTAKKSARILKNIREYLGQTMKMLGLNKKGPCASRIEVIFNDPEEGQHLYWDFPEGTKGLIWFP
jgi:hypothetical protein